MAKDQTWNQMTPAEHLDKAQEYAKDAIEGHDLHGLTCALLSVAHTQAAAVQQLQTEEG